MGSRPVYLCACVPSVQVTSVVASAQLRGTGGTVAWVNSKRLFGVAERELPSWPSRPAAGALACLQCCCTGTPADQATTPVVLTTIGGNGNGNGNGGNGGDD
jgi:hypothetical protein